MSTEPKRISDRQIEALHAIAEAGQAIAAALRETAQPEDAQIDAPVPAERTQGESGGSRVYGTPQGAPAGSLGSRLRFAAMYTPPEMRGRMTDLAAEADRLEATRDQAQADHHRSARASWDVQVRAEKAEAQVEAVRAEIEREAAHGEAITRCNLVAERFRTVLDSVNKPYTADPEGA